jgi:hypothetical protein
MAAMKEVMVIDSAEMKECVFCAELIKAAAKKCRHCGETLDPAMRKAEEAMRLAEGKASQNVNVNTNIAGQDYGRPRGSWIVLIFWIIFFFPVAIIYFLIRRWW